MQIVTPRFTLVLQSREEVLAMVAAMVPEERAQVSPAWLERVKMAESDRHWQFSFEIRENGQRVGIICFKGPPITDAAVEIAYSIDEPHRNRGIATEATTALTEFAFRQPEVMCVRAHTLPEPNASTRVLTKSGFTCLGAIQDPEDGTVWRWERNRTGLNVDS